MLRRGLEPPQDYSHTPLKRTRLPVPPPEHICRVYRFSPALSLLLACGIVPVMSPLSREALSLWYRLIYFFSRVRGVDNDEAIYSARRTAMKKVGKMIDARTQVLAQRICSNC